MIEITRGSVAALLLLLAAAWGCAAVRPPETDWVPEPAIGSPLIWRVDLGPAPLFLLGSIHVGTPEMADLGPAVGRAWEASQELVVEVNLERIPPDELLATTLRYAALPPGVTLPTVLSEPTWRALSERLARHGLSADDFATLKPWYVSTMLYMLSFQAAGLVAEHGVDRHLMLRAGDARPIVELETLEEQFAMFDGLSAEVQEQMLAEALRSDTEIESDSVDLAELWASGDEAGLLEHSTRSLDETPALAPFYEAVIEDRNVSMARRLEELMRDGVPRFAVVGVAHLVGPRGIPALLAARGYAVERLRPEDRPLSRAPAPGAGTLPGAAGDPPPSPPR